MPPSFPLYPFSLMCRLYLASLYFVSRSPCPLSLSVPLSPSLPRCIRQILLIPTAFQPLQWLHGLATQLGAHYSLIHRLEDRQRLSVPFLLCAPRFHHFISLSPQALFKQKGAISLPPPPSHSSHHTLRYSTSSLPAHNEPACVKKN